MEGAGTGAGIKAGRSAAERKGIMASRDTIRRKPKDTKGTFKRLFAYIGQYKWILAFVLVLCFVSNVLALIGPSLAGAAINEAAAGAGKVNFDRVYYFAGRMLLAYVFSSLITVTINIVMMYVSRHIAKGMRREVFAKLMRLDRKSVV